MNKFKHFVGIDVSKESFDVAFELNDSVFHGVFQNTKKGVKELKSWVRKKNIRFEDVLFCMEHTGVYSRSLSTLMLQEKLSVWIEMAYKIKHSIGLVRGKSDKADALVIARYAARFADKAMVIKKENGSMYEKLQDLLAQRDRLILTKNAILKPVEELKKMNIQHAKEMIKSLDASLKGLSESLEKTEKMIQNWLEENPKDHLQIKKMLSVPGVGKITALYIWASTQAMSKCANYKQLACYSGVAPFKNQSGTSVYKKTAVSHMANKKIKKILHMAVLSCIQRPGELQDYYHRKVKEGKAKMLVINNLKNKILARIFAVIKYQQNYQAPNLVLS